MLAPLRGQAVAQESGPDATQGCATATTQHRGRPERAREAPDAGQPIQAPRPTNVVMYASQTGVSTERSKGEVERLLSRAGATSFMSGYDGTTAMLGFKLHDRLYSIRFQLPSQEDYAFTPGGRRRRSAVDMLKHHEQGCRSRWRAIVLIIKAKLEAVEIGVMTVEEAFATDLVLGRGLTVGQAVRKAVEFGKIPAALPLLEEES